MPTGYPAAMLKALSNRRWPLLLFAACLALTLVLWASRAWVWIGVPPINEAREPFSDTLIHLATAVNCADGLGEWYGRACFVPNIDAVPRAQTYEPWLSLHRLGVDSLWHVQAIAVSMIALFYLAMCLCFRPRSLSEATLVLALLMTPGVQLAVERGNFDLLIAALLALAATLLARPLAGAGLLGIATLSLATMLKLYTGLACVLAWLIGSVRWRWLLPASLAGLVLAVLVVGPRELMILGQGAPEGATRFSTGARWLFLHAGTAWALAAIALATGVAMATWLHLRRLPMPIFRRWPLRLALFQLAALTALPLFLLKNSYDYRLVLWLPCLALPLAMLRQRPDMPACVGGAARPKHDVQADDEGAAAVAWRRLALAVIGLYLIIAGAELPASWLDALAQHIDSDWPNRAASTIGLAKQFASWMLAALLALLFAFVTFPGFVRSREARAAG